MLIKREEKKNLIDRFSREIQIRVHMNSPPMAMCERSLASNDAYQSVGSSRSSLF